MRLRNATAKVRNLHERVYHSSLQQLQGMIPNRWRRIVQIAHGRTRPGKPPRERIRVVPNLGSDQMVRDWVGKRRTWEAYKSTKVIDILSQLIVQDEVLWIIQSTSGQHPGWSRVLMGYVLMVVVDVVSVRKKTTLKPDKKVNSDTNSDRSDYLRPHLPLPHSDVGTDHPHQLSSTQSFSACNCTGSSLAVTSLLQTRTLFNVCPLFCGRVSQCWTFFL